MMMIHNIDPSYYWLPLVGFIIALIGTVIGGGGGFFLFPLLTLVFGLPAHSAVATSLVATLPICLVGAISHFKHGFVAIRPALVFAVAGVVGVGLGTFFIAHITGPILKKIFGVYTLCIAIQMFYDTYVKNIRSGKYAFNKAKSIFLGISAGTVSETFGTSGTAPIIAGLFHLDLPVKVVVGTSLCIAFVNSLIASVSHVLVSEISYLVIIAVTAGALPGAILGPLFLKHREVNPDSTNVKSVYASVILLIGVIMLLK